VNAERGTRRDELLLALLASAASIAAFLHYYRSNEILLYGDSVAHINIARRVFDSITPGPLQLGTVWLPLPHVLAIPFVISNWMWKTGVGGSIVSIFAYVAGTIGVYRLTRIFALTTFASGAPPSGVPHLSRSLPAAGLLGALIYAANPNLLYLQATAMTESLYLALFIWTMVLAAQWLQARDPVTATKKLERCGFTLAGAMLTRYDGWFLAACLTIVVLSAWVVRALRRNQSTRDESSSGARLPSRLLLEFILLLIAVAGVWFAHNYREFGSPAEFATGPYSARAIEHRTADAYNGHHPGYHRPVVAAQYFLKAAKLNMGAGRWELPLMVTAVLGVLVMLVGRKPWVALLLWVPLPFYAFSIAYGDVPIFLPAWWPFSYYNTRYGVELLPAIAVFTGILAARWLYVGNRAGRLAIAVAAFGIVAGSYLSVWRTLPICLREAHANGDSRQRFEIVLAHDLQNLPSSSHLLMSTGDHPGALERAGIPLRRVINETNHPKWEQALAAPAQQADYIIALGGDDVAQCVVAHPSNLLATAIVNMPSAPGTTIYKSLLRDPP